MAVDLEFVPPSPLLACDGLWRPNIASLNLRIRARLSGPAAADGCALPTLRMVQHGRRRQVAAGTQPAYHRPVSQSCRPRALALYLTVAKPHSSTSK